MLNMSDTILISACALSSFYCFFLLKKIKNLTNLESEIGAAIAILSREVDELTKITALAQKVAASSNPILSADDFTVKRATAQSNQPKRVVHNRHKQDEET